MAHTWVGTVLEYEFEVPDPLTDGREKITMRRRLCQRSDGVLFYLQWESDSPQSRQLEGYELAEYRADREKSRERLWVTFLGQETTIMPALPGYVETSSVPMDAIVVRREAAGDG